MFYNLFEIYDAEASSLSNRGRFMQMLNTKINKSIFDNKNIVF
jgi:hypothetical protein